MLSRFSRVQPFVIPWTKPTRLLYPWDSPGNNTGVDCYAFLQEIFLTQGLNPGLLYLLHWRSGPFTTSTTWEAQKMAYYEGKRKNNNLLPHVKTKMNITDVMMGKKPDTKSACYTIPIIWN